MVNSLAFKLKYYVIIILVCFFQSCYNKQNSKISLDPTPLNQILDNYVENGIWPFLYSRIEYGITGELLYEHLAINKSLLSDKTINGDTWMRIWSMSKLITISIALDLMEEGIINIDDPVEKYIPESSLKSPDLNIVKNMFFELILNTS